MEESLIVEAKTAKQSKKRGDSLYILQASTHFCDPSLHVVGLDCVQGGTFVFARYFFNSDCGRLYRHSGYSDFAMEGIP